MYQLNLIYFRIDIDRWLVSHAHPRLGPERNGLRSHDCAVLLRLGGRQPAIATALAAGCLVKNLIGAPHLDRQGFQTSEHRVVPPVRSSLGKFQRRKTLE